MLWLQYATRRFLAHPPSPNVTSNLRHQRSSTSSALGGSIRRVAVIGAGPSGFYVSKYLLKELGSEGRIDMIDRLPTPFGLVRSGVAPDHPEVKSVQKDFEKVAEDPRFNFYGNVFVGKDIDITEMRALYDVIVFAYGASEDRRLGIPGEDLKGVLSARTFVNWYNGHPDYATDASLTDYITSIIGQEGAIVVILGQGNVALDCARILAKRPEDLKNTDICHHALETLSKSKVKHISVVGRRGHGQAAFTIKELRELSRIEGTKLVVDPTELQQGLTPSTVHDLEHSRPRKRLAGLVQSLPPLVEAEAIGTEQRTVALRFLLMPKEVLPQKENAEAVGAIVMERTKLEGPPGKVVAVPTGGTIEMPCQLVLRSIGYKSSPMEGVPFDGKRAVVKNREGRVYQGDSQVHGFYCTGWVKRGPSGIINTNIIDARETVAAILEDAKAGLIPSSSSPTGVDDLRRSPVPSSSSSASVEGEEDGLMAAIAKKGRKAKDQIVTWQGYQKIDAHETKLGQEKGKPREKIIHAADLIKIANS